MPQIETSSTETSEDTFVTEEGWVVRLRPREEEAVTLGLPTEALAQIDRIAVQRDMSRFALLRDYIGQGLRQDLAREYQKSFWKKTEQVLTQRLKSKEEVAAILEEIRTEKAA